MKAQIATAVLPLLVAAALVACSGGSSGSGGGTTPDTNAPTVPTGVVVKSSSSNSMAISWTASTDAVGVTGYKVFRDGAEVGIPATNSYNDTGLSPRTAYNYTISAYDAAANNSAQSSAVSGTTLAALVPATRSVGVFVAGWHWGLEFWSEAADDDLILSAKNQSVSVIHLFLPQFERPLGTYIESELIKLDHFLDSASNNGMYVMISFINIYGNLAVQTDDPYYNPSGIEGLMFDDTLKTAFKNRIAMLMNRQNTINSKLYKDDPTIAAWIIGDEPISAPSNYPSGQAPDITVQQFATWLEEMSAYVKSIDNTGAVSIFIQPAQSTLTGGDWIASLDVPSVDFVYGEDADMNILNHFSSTAAADYSLRLFEIGKPVIVQLAFTSGAWEQTALCSDYTYQKQLLLDATTEYANVGARSVIVQNWGTDLYTSVPSFAVCYTYSDSNVPISEALSNMATLLTP